jgi:anti-sigma factor RsiW
MTMHCGRSRRLLWPDDGPKVVGPETEEAQAHLEACERCRRFLDDMRAVAERMHALAPRPQAPPSVRERLFTAIARERAALPPPPSRSRRVQRRAAVVAAAAFAFLGVALWLTGRQGGPAASRTPIAAIAEDHARALHDQSIHTSDTDAVRDWLASRIPFAVRVPEIPDASLEGARLCLLNGKRGAVLRYRVDDRLVSYFIMPAERTDGALPDAAAFRHEAEAGYRVVAWREAGLIHALVGDLPRERLDTLARFCAHRTAALRADERPLLTYVSRIPIRP